MLTDATALELFEYKVKDLTAEREPIGGVASVQALYDYLSQRPLSADMQRRFVAASGAFMRFTSSKHLEISGFDTSLFNNADNGAEAESEPLSFDELELGTSVAEEAAKQVLATEAAILLSPAEREEQRILKNLAKRVWWAEVERALGRMAATYRAERERYTARLLYGVLRNLARYAQSDTFTQDPTLVHFEVTESVLERSDPLYSFSDIGSVTELLLEFTHTALNFKGPKSPYRKLSLDETQTLTYLRRLTLAVARDPYAGRLSSLPAHDMSAQQLRQSLQALGREPLSEGERAAQRSALEVRLQAALERERAQRSLFERDVAAFARAAELFFGQLEQHLPKRVGGEMDEPRLAGGVLFAENSALNLTSVARSAATLSVRLKGPVRFSLAGLDVAVIGAADAWTLVLEGQERSLTQGVRAKGLHLEVMNKRVAAFLEEDYLYLEVREDVRSLPTLVAEALAVYTTLRLGLSELLRTAVGVPEGELRETAKRSLAQLRRLLASAPDKRRALEGLCQGAAKASGTLFVGSTKEIFLHHLHLAITSPEEDLIASLKGVRQQLLDEPLNLRVAGQPLSVRRYQERSLDKRQSVVVMVPGAPLGALSDYALFDIAGGTLLCALAAGEFAAIYLEGETAQTLY